MMNTGFSEGDGVMIGSSEAPSDTPKTRRPIFVPGYGVVIRYPDTMVKWYIEPKMVRVVSPEGVS